MRRKRLFILGGILALLALGLFLLGRLVVQQITQAGVLTFTPAGTVPHTDAAYADFWEAIADFDPVAALALATSPDEQALAVALRHLFEARLDSAAFHLQQLREEGEAKKVVAAAEQALGQVLLFDARWEALLQLADDAPALLQGGPLTEGDLLFARAMQTQPPERYSFPAPSVTLSSGRILSGSPRLPIVINGCERQFVVDTGAGVTAISSEVAEACGIAPLGETTGEVGTSTSTTIPFRPARIDRLELGGLVIENHPAAILEAEDLEFGVAGLAIIKIDGIIGWPVFREVSFEIDDTKGETTLRPAKRDATGGERNFFWLGYPVVTLRSATGKRLNFGLDTGAASTSIKDRFLEKMPGNPVETKGGFSIGAGGGERVSRRRIRDVTLYLDDYALHFDDLSTSDGVKSAVLWRPDGQLGASAARDATLTLDWLNGRYDLAR